MLSHRRRDYKLTQRPPQTSNTGRYILMIITQRSHYRRDTTVILTNNPRIPLTYWGRISK